MSCATRKQRLHCPVSRLVTLAPWMALNTRVSALFPHVGGGKQNQESWARAGLAPAAFLSCPFPLNHFTIVEEPRLGSAWLVLHSQA